MLIVMGSNNSHHANFSVNCGGDAELEIFENPTTSAPGTAINAVNNNRFSPNTADGTYYHTPTVTAAGTPLFATLAPGGAGGNSGGGGTTGESRGGAEFILKTGQTYLVRVTNRAGQAKRVSIAVGFYEE
jgi:hypothetical protein